MEGKFGTPILGRDDDLETALRHFIVVRHTPTGVPVFGMSDSKIEDHDLDAWMLALLAFTLSHTNVGKSNATSNVAYLNSIMGMTPRTGGGSRSFTGVSGDFVNSEGIATMDPEEAEKVVAKKAAKRLDRVYSSRSRRGFTGRGFTGRNSGWGR